MSAPAPTESAVAVAVGTVVVVVVVVVVVAAAAAAVGTVETRTMPSRGVLRSRRSAATDWQIDNQNYNLFGYLFG